MLRNGDGNKGHIECLPPVPQHGAQVCAQIPGERTDDGADAVHVGGKAAGAVP